MAVSALGHSSHQVTHTAKETRDQPATGGWLLIPTTGDSIITKGGGQAYTIAMCLGAQLRLEVTLARLRLWVR